MTKCTKGTGVQWSGRHEKSGRGTVRRRKGGGVGVFLGGKGWDDASVGEEGRAGSRHVAAAAEVEVRELRSSGGDRPEPGVRHVFAAAEVKGLAAGASGGVRLEPDISQTFHKHFTNISQMALTDTPCLEPKAKQSSRPCPGCLRLGPPTKSLGRHSVHVIRGRRHRRSHLFCVNLSDGVKRIPTAAAVAVAIDPCRVDHITLL